MKVLIVSLLTPYLLLLGLIGLRYNTQGFPVVSKTVQVLSVTDSGELEEKDLIINGNYHQFSLDFRSVHPGLPFTQEKHLRPCSEYFDEAEEFTKALQCANKKVFSKSPYTSELEPPKIPKCNIVTTDSPDVRETPDFNYISMDILGKTLAFYDTETQVIFVVETYDMKMIYRHELQHYFLALKDGGERCDHCHEMWNQCEPPRYDPTEASINEGKKKRKGFSFRLIENFYNDAIIRVKGIKGHGEKRITKSPGNGSKEIQKDGRGQPQVLRQIQSR
jgi:hypothetical protein